MLDTLITSKTRIKLLLKFFLNSKTTSYLRDLEAEFGESTNSIRLELNRFEKADLLTSAHSGNKKIFKANDKHPLFRDIHSLLLKYTGLDHVIEKVLHNLGDLHSAYLIGDFARGKNGMFIDLLLVGDHIDNNYLLPLIEKAERMIKRKIRYIIVNTTEAEKYLQKEPYSLLLWRAE